MDLFDNQPPIERPDTSRHLQDPYVAVSALQKAARRGHQQIALAATSYLIDGHADRMWRRLVVIALEDVGIGDLDLVRDTLLASTRKGWRTEHGGDWPVASGLVSRLCAANKDRNSCELLVATDLHPRWATQRTVFLDLTQNQLCDIVADPARHLVERTLASWFIAGTKRFPAYSLPEVTGSFPVLLDVHRHIGVPDHVLEVAKLGSTRTVEGHPLTLPLVWLTAGEGSVTVEYADLPEPVLIQGWPTYAYDMHCRIGRRALVRFANRCKALRQMIDRYLPVGTHADLVGHVVFRIEGHVVDRRLAYPGAGGILADAEIAHLTYSGFPENLVTDLLSVLGNHLDLLLQCRIEAAGGRA